MDRVSEFLLIFVLVIEKLSPKGKNVFFCRHKKEQPHTGWRADIASPRCKAAVIETKLH